MLSSEQSSSLVCPSFLSSSVYRNRFLNSEVFLVASRVRKYDRARKCCPQCGNVQKLESNDQQNKRHVVAVVGGGAAGIFAAIRAKSLYADMDVVVFEKNQLLSKVKISGGGRCNVTTGLFRDPLLLSEQYPRGHKELRGSFFRMHGPEDTAMWFSERGVALKVSLPEVRAELQVAGQKNGNPNLIQMGPMLITHWGLSGPVVLRLSAWAARELFSSKYKGILWVDLVPKFALEDVVRVLNEHRKSAAKRKLGSGSPSEFPLGRRFWQYILLRVELNMSDVWATLSNSDLRQLASSIKRCSFPICGKGDFKEEFVTAGGVPLAEVDLKTMESRLCPHLFFAGEILNVDGVTGGFNFQNAWTGGYIAGTTIASVVKSSANMQITEQTIHGRLSS